MYYHARLSPQEIMYRNDDSYYNSCSSDNDSRENSFNSSPPASSPRGGSFLDTPSSPRSSAAYGTATSSPPDHRHERFPEEPHSSLMPSLDNNEDHANISSGPSHKHGERFPQGNTERLDGSSCSSFSLDDHDNNTYRTVERPRSSWAAYRTDNTEPRRRQGGEHQQCTRRFRAGPGTDAGVRSGCGTFLSAGGD